MVRVVGQAVTRVLSSAGCSGRPALIFFAILKRLTINGKNVKSKLLFLLIVVVVAGFIWYWQSGGDDTQNNSEMLNGVGDYEIISADTQYFENSNGYFARPASDGTFPGVIMIHEWWGLNDNIKDMARQLAAEGYIVLAVDLYNGEVAADSARARELTSGLDQETATANMEAALNYLREHNATRLASLGWCFGGGQSMQLALAGQDLDATVIYYGNLVTEVGRLENINWPVLGVFGDQDQSIPVDTVNQFETALNGAGVQNEIYIYEGVGHAFANPSGDNYAPEETMDAWEKTLSFLERSLK